MNRKGGPFIGILAALPIVSVAATASSGGAAAPASPPRFGPPFPFTVDDLWRKILYVIDAPGGMITPNRVEQTFHFQFPPPTPEYGSKVPDHYQVLGGADWYATLSVTDDGARGGDFGFGWTDGSPTGNGLSDPPPGYCIVLSEVQASLRAHGWTYGPVEHLVGVPPIMMAHKPGIADMTTYFDRRNRCLITLEMFYGPHSGH